MATRKPAGRKAARKAAKAAKKKPTKARVARRNEPVVTPGKAPREVVALVRAVAGLLQEGGVPVDEARELESAVAAVTRDPMTLPAKGHDHPEHDCGGSLLAEHEVYVRGRTVRVAVEGRHHSGSRPDAPWDCYELSEIVKREGGGTEMLDADPTPLNTLPSADDVREVVERWERERRDGMLAEVAAGLALLDKPYGVGRPETEPTGKVPLWRVEVALLTDKDEVLAVAPIAEGLRWVVDGVHQTGDTTDISGATRAHVQVHESGKCLSCDKGEHRDPGDAERDAVEAARKDEEE